METVTDIDRRRYAKQLALAQVGLEGQRRLARSSVVVLGSGALGSAQAQLLVRAGIGALRLIDFDVVEESNLHRQMLFDEEDARAGRFKAEVAVEKLRRANSGCRLDAQVVRADEDNLGGLLDGYDLALDATDNLEARCALNAVCRRRAMPWVHGGVLGTSGVMLPIFPDGPCLLCAFGEPPPRGTLPTCNDAGILASVVLTVASLQAATAMRILLGERVPSELLAVDVWNPLLRRIEVSRDPDCPLCGARPSAERVR